MDLARLLARVTVGGLFVGHGTQKLFGWFGGPAMEGTTQMMQSLRLRPARGHALAAGATEAGGGLLVALGLALPAAAAGLSTVMLTAIRKVHWKNGPWNTNGGYELNAVLIAALLALVEAGPGRLSIDHLRGRERTGTLWALAALAAAAAASWAVTKTGERESRPEATPEQQQEDQPIMRERAAA